MLYTVHRFHLNTHQHMDAVERAHTQYTHVLAHIQIWTAMESMMLINVQIECFFGVGKKK